MFSAAQSLIAGPQRNDKHLRGVSLSNFTDCWFALNTLHPLLCWIAKTYTIYNVHTLSLSAAFGSEGTGYHRIIDYIDIILIIIR